MKKGKLIVIDGSDGSGKATQAKLLVKALRKSGKKVRTLDFPQYEKQFFGRFIKNCLMGNHGDFVNLDPRIASVLYAADRFEAKEVIEKWISAGYVVVLDRYVSSNQIHQGGKIANLKKRKDYLEWQEEMEFTIFKLPRPNCVIYLEVPVRFSQSLLDNSGKKQDTAEKDVTYLENSVKCARWLAKNRKNWEYVKCVEKGKLRSIEDIHQEISDIV